MWKAACMDCGAEGKGPFIKELDSRLVHWELMEILEAVACWESSGNLK